MADNTPIANLANIRLAQFIEDPVTGADNGSAASTDGLIWTAIARNNYVSEASRALVTELVGRLGLEDSADELQGAIATQPFVTSALGQTLNKDYMFVHRCLLNNIEAKYVKVKGDLDQDLDPYLDLGFTINAGLIYVYKRVNGVLVASDGDAAVFQYLSAGRTDPITGATIGPNLPPDIKFDSRWYDFLSLYGAGRAALDAVSAIADPDPDLLPLGNRYIAMAMSKLPQPRMDGKQG